MTYPIVARDAQSGHLGVAVASRFFAVGALVPHLRAGVGAIATQAFCSPLYGTDGLALLAAGASVEEALRSVTARAAGRQARQVNLIDAAGRRVPFTAQNFVDCAGPGVGQGGSVGGNTLRGQPVPERGDPAKAG